MESKHYYVNIGGSTIIARVNTRYSTTGARLGVVVAVQNDADFVVVVG
jgi:hypothetical protein